MTKHKLISTAKKLLANTKNTRKILAEEVEELYGIIESMRVDIESAKMEAGAYKRGSEWLEGEIKRLEQEQRVLEGTIVFQARERALGMSS